MSGLNEAEGRLRFQGYIQDVLANKPDWLDNALQGIASGMDMALKASHSRQAELHMAMCLALMLTKPGRISQEERDLAGSYIRKIIEKQSGGTLAEAQFLERQNGNS